MDNNVLHSQKFSRQKSILSYLQRKKILFAGGLILRSTAHFNFMDVVRRLMFRWLICKSCSRRQAFCIISQAVHNATSATPQAWKSPTSHTTGSSNTNMRQKWLYDSRALHVFCIHQETLHCNSA